MVRIRGRQDERDRHDPQDDFSWTEVPPWAIQILRKQDLIIGKLLALQLQQEYIMGTYKDLGDAIARNTSASSSVLDMLAGIVQQLKDAQAQNDPAAIDEAIKSLDANTNRLAAAAVKSTSADPVPQEPLPPPVVEPPTTPPQDGTVQPQ